MRKSIRFFVRDDSHRCRRGGDRGTYIESLTSPSFSTFSTISHQCSNIIFNLLLLVLSSWQVRRMMYEEICKFRPEVAVLKGLLCTPPRAPISPMCSPRTEENSPVEASGALGISAKHSSSSVGGTTLPFDLRLQCSTDRQSCDTNDTTPGIHLFDRSDSSTLFSSDSSDCSALLSRSDSSNLAPSFSASIDHCPSSSLLHSEFSVSVDFCAEKGIAHQAERRKSETLPTPAPHGKQVHSLPPAVPRLSHPS